MIRTPFLSSCTGYWSILVSINSLKILTLFKAGLLTYWVCLYRENFELIKGNTRFRWEKDRRHLSHALCFHIQSLHLSLIERCRYSRDRHHLLVTSSNSIYVNPARSIMPETERHAPPYIWFFGERHMLLSPYHCGMSFSLPIMGFISFNWKQNPSRRTIGVHIDRKTWSSIKLK